MLIAKSKVKSKDNDCLPLHKKFRDESHEISSFCERQEFSIKFTCMILFAISLILCGSLISEFIKQENIANDV